MLKKIEALSGTFQVYFRNVDFLQHKHPLSVNGIIFFLFKVRKLSEQG